jgi:hypothetical protein
MSRAPAALVDMESRAYLATSVVFALAMKLRRADD